MWGIIPAAGVGSRIQPLAFSKELLPVGSRQDGGCALDDRFLSFLMFPVERPELFDAVVTDAQGRVQTIQVKQQGARSNWIWGAIKMPGGVLHELHDLWCERGKKDEFLGTLINSYLEKGGKAWGVKAGTAYVDVGTLNGYREAIRLLSEHSELNGRSSLKEVGFERPNVH